MQLEIVLTTRINTYNSDIIRVYKFVLYITNTKNTTIMMALIGSRDTQNFLAFCCKVFLLFKIVSTMNVLHNTSKKRIE